MALKMKGFWPVALWVGIVAGLSAQAPGRPAAGAPASPASPASQDQPTFRVQVAAVTQDVVVKDDRGNFVPNLTRDDFEVYEDGVKQDIVTMTMVSGGRVSNILDAPPTAAPEGIILPPAHRVNDTSGRIFLFFVDDLHVQFSESGRVRDLFKRVAKNLVHDGDLFGIVSSGPSSISIDMTYDRKRLDEAISKMTGDGLKPDEIINSNPGAQGPAEVRYREQVAFSTMQEALANLDQVHDRRKALVWVSDGYDLNPFQDSRLGLTDPSSPFLTNHFARVEQSLATQPDPNTGQAGAGLQNDPDTIAQKQSEEFAEADLIMDLAEITRAANRSNVTIYAIDPRGLMAGADIDQPVETSQWNDYVTKTQNSLRILADETGGIAVVNQNDFDKALKRIDADTSDYYVLGYYSSNPDVRKRRRAIDVKMVKKGLSVTAARKEYVLKNPAKPATTPAPPPPVAKQPKA
jgi:VWFA-related protein